MLPDAEVDHHAMVEAKIIRMANQIATYFDSRPEAERLAGIAAHINDFWEPRMRTHLFELAASQSGNFKALVIESLPMIRKPKR